jgi:PAS domain S-box-containing protein
MTQQQSYGIYSLRFKLALASIVVEVVMLAILIANSVNIATEALEDQAKYRVNEIMPLLNASIAAPLVQRDYASLDEILVQVVHRGGIEYIAVVDEMQQVVSEVGKRQPYSGYDALNERQGGAKDGYLYLDAPVKLMEQTVGGFHLTINTKRLENAISALKREGMAIAGAEIVISFFLLALLGILLTRSLAVLAAAAHTLSGGDLSVRINSRSKDEIGFVSNAFDNMAERLGRLYDSLKASEKRYQILAEVMPCGLFHADEAGNCIYANETLSEIFEIPREAFLGKGWIEAVYEQDREKVAQGWYESAQHGQPYQAEFRMQGNKPAPLWVLVQAAPTLDEQGRQAGYVGTVTDISRLKLAEQELADHRDRLEQLVVERTADLEEAQERLIQQEQLAVLGRLTATVSHELRNPLGVIGNAVYYLKRKLKESDPKVKEYLGIIERELVASNRIITDLLTTSRIKDPIAEWINLDELLNSTLNELQLPAGISWEYHAPVKPFYMRADPLQLRQVLLNLILNAAQAIEGKGQIVLSAREGNNGYELRLNDDGPGIAEKNKEDIFRPLFTTKAKGNGLGLWVSREIARRHNGELTLCEGELSGACFLLRLPRR